ncbi:MAG: biliverdin-producing heme oxygenase [Acetobacter cibinongensis]
MSPSPRRFCLRQGTWATHQALDSLIGPLNTQAAYKRYLLAVYTLRKSFEAAINEVTWPEHFATWRPTMLAAAMEQDLADLGLAAPPVQPLPLFSNASSLLGALYVTEGASLGARLLVRQAASLGMTANFGARHLTQQVAENEQWTHFLTVLDQAPEFDDTLAIETALSLFSYAMAAVHRADAALEVQKHG